MKTKFFLSKSTISPIFVFRICLNKALFSTSYSFSFIIYHFKMDFSALAVLKPFVITLREGFEIALIVGILYSYVVKKGEEEAKRGSLSQNNGDAKKMVWLGLGVAAVLSIGFGVGLASVQASIPKAYGELMEGILAFISAALLLYMVLWMNHGKISGELRSAVDNAVDAPTPLWSIFSISFLSVLREGFETILFLHTAAEKQTSADVTLSYGLAVLGLAVSAVLGYYIFARSSKLPMKEIFSYTSLLLVIFAAWMIFVGFTACGVSVYDCKSFELPLWLQITRWGAFVISAVLGVRYWKTHNK
jgi:high-affinity iron transporter